MSSPTASSTDLLSAAVAEENSGALERALDRYRSLAQLQPNEPRWRLECVRLLMKMQREGEALRAFGEAQSRWPHIMSEERFRTLIPAGEPTEQALRSALKENCPSDAELKRGLVLDDGVRDAIIARGGRKAAVIVFTGLADRVVMPLPLFDRYLAELDLSAIYLRDRSRLAFLQGVRSLGPDYEATVGRLREALSELGAETVHTIGNSAGGLGAISYGLDLGAEHMVGFASPILASEEVSAWDHRAPVFLKRMCELVPGDRRDLPARIARADKGHVRLIYGADSEPDRRHAELLRGSPRVTLDPLEGLMGHGAVFALADRGRLRPLLRELFGAA